MRRPPPPPGDYIRPQLQESCEQTITLHSHGILCTLQGPYTSNSECLARTTTCQYMFDMKNVSLLANENSIHFLLIVGFYFGWNTLILPSSNSVRHQIVQ